MLLLVLRKRAIDFDIFSFLNSRLFHIDLDQGNIQTFFIISQIETCLWLYEAYQPLDREMLVRLSHELIYGPSIPVAPSPIKPASAAAPLQKPMAPPQQPHGPVFQYTIKVCFQNLCGRRCPQAFFYPLANEDGGDIVTLPSVHPRRRENTLNQDCPVLGSCLHL